MQPNQKINVEKLKAHFASLDKQQNIWAEFWTQLCLGDTDKPLGQSEAIWATSFDDACRKASRYWTRESKVPDGMSYMVWGSGGSIKLVTPLANK